MKKSEYLDTIQDRMGQVNTNMARKMYHPKIIEYTLDRHYREMVSRVNFYRQDQISVCLTTLRNQTVYKDDNTNDLFCVLPVLVLPILQHQGGVLSVKKSTDPNVYFEPYRSNFEQRNKGRLNASFIQKVMFWYRPNITAQEISQSAVTLGDYQNMVWFDSPSTDKLENEDTVDLDVLKSVLSHDDQEQINVPEIQKMSGERLLVNSVVAEIYSKLGITEAQERAFQNKDINNEE